MAIRIVFDNGGLRNLEDHVSDKLHKVADDITDDMRRLVPVDTGALRTSIKVSHRRLRSRIHVGTGYWRYVEYGTAAHTITSHGNYPLRNRAGRVFGRTVRHPGTPAQPFIRPAVYRVRSI